MISKTIQDAIAEQVKYELDSAYLYLSMSSYCEVINLNGFSKWLRAQAQEELGHAMKLFDYVHERGGRVLLKGIDEPQAKFKNVHDVFDSVLEHEKKVTSRIHKLYELVVKEGDYATQIQLQWFITEQVEEEKNASEIVQQLDMVGENKSMLLYMDGKMGMRSGG